jgi:hypothetical protein
MQLQSLVKLKSTLKLCIQGFHSLNRVNLTQEFSIILPHAFNAYSMSYVVTAFLPLSKKILEFSTAQNIYSA